MIPQCGMAATMPSPTRRGGFPLSQRERTGFLDDCGPPPRAGFHDDCGPLPSGEFFPRERAAELAEAGNSALPLCYLPFETTFSGVLRFAPLFCLRRNLDHGYILWHKILRGHSLDFFRCNRQEARQFLIEQVRVLENHRSVPQLVPTTLGALPAQNKITQDLVLCFLQLSRRDWLAL